MKEIDFKILQGLIKEEFDVLNLKYIIVFILINIIVAIINWFIQRNIKNIESKIYKKKVREDRRITVIEEIYSELVSFTYILDKEEMINSINRISSLEKKVSQNRLYIESKMNVKITKYLDYLKSLLSDFRHKNFDLEKKLLDSIEKEFNK
ncbi:hypothetical protein B0A67_15885 [Flavobacterium aquidurense]|jgi:hypothetical protein|uniref:hypothetical protein n=1 Tax=Flavobacterium aquidurense TaxID=362413 RepID=UPI0009159D2C|nr:hypothetical protein [Flavobacterium aquidurense]OXA70395.1 hypothetical protein B0A67_15885 [Flavobacterium aquidurense]SHH68711.1 hypothetical protein SAMN05444481_12373 [Flavobacterium frigidimaris]